MGLYERFVLTRAVNKCCGVRSVARQRAKVVPRASGTVVEIGIGSGYNLPFYDAEQVDGVVGIDPGATLLKQAGRAARDVDFDVDLVEQSGETLPFDDASFDSAVVTYTLCSIDRVEESLREVRRVLRSDGRLFFIEHGKAPDEKTRRWQNRLTPIWRRIGGGCRLNRDIPGLIEAAGFEVADLETLYLPGARWLNYNFWGSARPA